MDTLCFYGVGDGTRLHFRLRRKYRFGSVKPSPATLHRSVAFNGSSPSDIKRQDTKRYPVFYGVGDGTRTHNAWNHNPVLCQLNYTHHINFKLNGTPGGTRTPDLLLRRQLLYPAELLAHFYGAGDGNRTRVSSLEGWCSTIELHPQIRVPGYSASQY